MIDKIQKKIAVLDKLKECDDLEIKANLVHSIKTMKNEITSLTRKSKKDFYNNYFSKNKNNLQKIWKGIKEVINIKSKNFSHPTCIIQNKKTINSPKEIANTFNTYYTSIAETLLKKRKYEGNSH